MGLFKKKSNDLSSNEKSQNTIDDFTKIQDEEPFNLNDEMVKESVHEILKSLEKEEKKESIIFTEDDFEVTHIPLVSYAYGELSAKDRPYFRCKNYIFSDLVNRSRSLNDQLKKYDGIDDNLLKSSFLRFSRSYEDTSIPKRDHYGYEITSNSNCLIEKIDLQNKVFKTEGPWVYAQNNRDSNSQLTQIVLICSGCRDVPISKITHFVIEDEQLYFYCDYHKHRMKQAEHLPPLEEFLDNFKNRNNAKIITQWKDFTPTTFKCSQKFLMSSPFVNIQGKDIEYEVGQKNEISEQLEKIHQNESKEAWGKWMDKTAEQFENEDKEERSELNRNNGESTVESSENENQKNNQTVTKDEYALNTISSIVDEGVNDSVDKVISENAG